MQTEFFLDLCFIRVHVRDEPFMDWIAAHLQQLFADKGVWTVRIRQEGQLEILLAEVQGIWHWQNKDMLFDYLEQEAAPQFWEWLQGYQLEFDQKEDVEYSYCNMR
jgi:hypothetical protein